jgi:biopolymer transport protein ExbB/TolQ
MTLGYAGVGGDPPLKVLAPGIAEAFMQVGFGLLAGTIAVFAHWAVESRIDRQVLGV